MSDKRFEEALERLEKIVRDLEKGDLPLEEALKAFEEGMTWVTFCSRKLEEAEKKVTMLVSGMEGSPVQVPFELPQEKTDEGTSL